MKSLLEEKALTRTLSTRVPASFADRIEAEAAAAGLSRSEYISRKLTNRQAPMHPVIAVLAQLMTIRARLCSAPQPDQPTLAELHQLIPALCALARAELER